MKPKQIIRLATDAAMTIALLLLMAYSLVGEAAHEWIGMAMLALFILHHALNRKWIGAVSRGRYTRLRTAQTVIAALVLVCMLGSMVSGIIISRHVFAFLPGRGVFETAAGTVHMLSAYWGFVLMSIHLGMHWNMVLSAVRRCFKHRIRLLGAAGYLFAAYGAVAFFRRDIADYLLLRTHFVFYDFAEPLALVLLDYVAVMALFVPIGFLSAKTLSKAK